METCDLWIDLRASRFTLLKGLVFHERLKCILFVITAHVLFVLARIQATPKRMEKNIASLSSGKTYRTDFFLFSSLQWSFQSFQVVSITEHTFTICIACEEACLSENRRSRNVKLIFPRPILLVSSRLRFPHLCLRYPVQTSEPARRLPYVYIYDYIFQRANNLFIPSPWLVLLCHQFYVTRS